MYERLVKTKYWEYLLEKELGATNSLAVDKYSKMLSNAYSRLKKLEEQSKIKGVR